MKSHLVAYSTKLWALSYEYQNSVKSSIINQNLAVDSSDTLRNRSWDGLSHGIGDEPQREHVGLIATSHAGDSASHSHHGTL